MLIMIIPLGVGLSVIAKLVSLCKGLDNERKSSKSDK